MCKKLFLVTSFLLVFGLVVNASGQPTGQIMREVWWDIGGGVLTTDLTNNAAYPDSPSFGELVTLLEAPTNIADNFGGRIHGYLYPATSGDYTFWIASDDYSDLWLSTSDNPDDAVVICGVDGWTDSRQFDGNVGAPGSRQMSAPIPLVGGQKYYISAIYKEGGGGDNLAVAWQGPDSPERSVIDGAFLSPAAWAPGLLKAQSPVPANNAVDADVLTLEWASGALAVSHVVYLNGEKIAETDLNLAAATLASGTTYTWRVDEVQADGTVIEGNEWTFTTLPLTAHFPSPADGAENVKSPATLTWVVGKSTVLNDVYFGADEALVAARDASTFKGKVMVASYNTGALELFSTYYWAVDEFTPAGTVKGDVWSFSTEKYLSILTGEKSLTYNNSAEPYVSELAFTVPADLTAEGVVADLTLSFQGQADNLSIDEATGTYKVAGAGADIWGTSDQFHYVYMELNGDAEISARVVSNGTGSNTWAKGGVMIRQSTAPDSQQMLMGMTGGDGGGIAFQGRFASAGANSSSLHGDLIAAPPYYVKLTRTGNTITAYSSADGVEWALVTDASPDNSGGTITNPIDVVMTDPVLIGLFVTSHAAGEVRTYTFDNVSLSGGVSGVIVSEDIASVSGNSAESVYVKLEDSTGAVASVTHGNPAATQITSWRNMTIPLSAFEGVDVTAAAKLSVGVGDGEPGGAGVLKVADVKVVEPDRTAETASWQAAADAASPVFIATNVADGTYDIGTYGGEQTYEFVVRSNPAEVEPSMALIGRRQLGDTKAGIKYEQWQNTGTYGATLFGVVDLDFGVATNPGVDTHLAFVSSVDAKTTKLYVNGEYKASVEEAISLSGSVGIGYGIQDPALNNGVATFDNFDGDIYGVAIYDAALSDDEIAAHSAAFFAPPTDVTVPGDIVKGVPNDNDWPGGEHPALAFDNKSSTKYLHFKGDFEPDPGTGGSGLQITPLDGPSVVTGLTFTTANDVPGRDPIAFELSGSNDSIDGPYTLIASGDIVDFAGEAEWPRFTMNATPIAFDNDVAYSHYQLIFTAIRGPVGGSVNSMQIAEVELIANQVAPSAAAPTVIWVSFHGADDAPSAGAVGVGFTEAVDKGYTDLLKANGYEVTRYVTTATPDPAVLNAADLVIISRSVASSGYQNDGATAWNSTITAPMIIINGYVLRSSRMGFTTGTDMPDITGDITLTVSDPTHPIFAGISLTDGTMDNPYAGLAVYPTDGTTAAGISINNNPLDDEGIILATISEASAATGPVGGVVIAEWQAGATLTHAGGAGTDVLAGHRLVFLTGARENGGKSSETAGMYDLYEDGAQMFLNAVDYMIP